jgi:predicted XRE-type DNA-binding protein
MEEPKSVIEQLLTQAEMTEAEISDALKEMGVEVSQATINRIKNGKHKHTRFDIGFGLLQLRAQRIHHSA